MATRKELIKHSIVEWDSMLGRAITTPRGNRAHVVKVYGYEDRMGSTFLYVDLSNGQRLAPYFNQSPEPSERRDIENDPELWAAGMAGATEWELREWPAA